MHATSFPGLVLLGSVFLFATPPAADAQPRTEPGVFGEVIDVRVVNLEIVVTDKQGNRVPGLGPDDFELTVDGKPVPIDFFTEIVSGTAVERPAAGDVKGVPQLVPGETVPRRVLLFIDDSFSRKNERDAVLESIYQQLEFLTPEDRIAIVAYDGERLEMLSTWRPRGTEIERAVRRAQTRPTHGMSWEVELRSYEFRRQSLQDELFSIGDPNAPTELTQTQEQALRSITNRVERVVLAAASTLRSFAAAPGRKLMLVVSGGWPYDPLRWVASHRERVPLESPAARREELYAPLIETANRLGYTLYPIDVPGVRTEGTLASERLPLDAVDAIRVDASSLPVDSATIGTMAFSREVELDATLDSLARETGGEAFLDARNLDALERVADDTSAYYWLGFTPDWKGTDKVHDVRVVAKRRGLEVRGRRSYADLSRQTEVTMMTESALLFGNPPSNEPLLAKVGRPTQVRGRSATVPLTVMIPVHLLTFLPHAEGFVAATELRVAVLDEVGQTADVPVIELPLVLDAPPEEGQVQRYETSLKLRRQKHAIVVSLYDVASGLILSTRVEVDPG